MLVDITFKESEAFSLETEDGVIYVRSKNNPDLKRCHLAERIETGVYWATDFLPNMLSSISDYDEDTTYPGWPWFYFGGLEKSTEPCGGLISAIDPNKPEIDLKTKFEAMRKSCESYGAADDLNQIKEYAKEHWTSDRKFILAVRWITKKHNPGWRWHKNGTYIGKHKRHAEHLGDEPSLERVMVFAFTEVKPKEVA